MAMAVLQEAMIAGKAEAEINGLQAEITKRDAKISEFERDSRSLAELDVELRTWTHTARMSEEALANSKKELKQKKNGFLEATEPSPSHKPTP